MKSSPAKIALIYLIAGVIWITTSDMLLARLWGTKVFTSPVLTGELIKGLAYIMVTSFLLFLLTRFYFRRLRRSWTAYRSLFEDNPAPMFAYAPQTFKIVAVNEAALHQYGYTKKEFLSMTVAQIRPEEDVQAFLDHIKPGEINFDKRKIWRHYTKGGKLLYVNISAQNGFLEGKKVRWVLVRDMTEMKEKERLLRETLERYELTMKATKDIIWDQTAADDKVLLHGAVFENFGYRISFANMKWLEDKIHPEDMTRVQTSLLKIYENADPYWSDQFRLKCTDGTYKYISVRGYIHYTDDKKAYRSIGVVQVIQKQKEYELKIETQNKLLKELAHTVSHKLRGPVASIKGILSLIEQNKNIPPDIETEFQYLTRSIRELDEVIHQMMESANKLYQL